MTNAYKSPARIVTGPNDGGDSHDASGGSREPSRELLALRREITKSVIIDTERL
jgi:hypothetical protein